jgi:hypothetical protein
MATSGACHPVPCATIPLRLLSMIHSSDVANAPDDAIGQGAKRAEIVLSGRAADHARS